MGGTAYFSRWLVIGAVLLATAATHPQVRIEHLATVGCGYCDGPEAFGQVVSLALDGDRLVVADGIAPHIRSFGLDGTLQAAVAPEGDGPGELRFPLGVALDGGRIRVADMRSQKVLELALDGVEIERTDLGAFPVAVGFAPGGDQAVISTADWIEGSARVVRWRDGDGAADATDADAVLLESAAPWVTPSDSGITMYFSLASAPDGGFAIAEGRARYRITRFSAEGDSILTMERQLERRPKSEEEIEAERASLARGPGGSGSSPEGRRPPPEVDPLHRHFSLQAVRFDDRGRLWVRTDRAADGRIFDVWSPGGELLAEVHVPARGTAFAVHGNVLAVEARDEFDVATVELYSVEIR